jgi:hypothetical protein
VSDREPGVPASSEPGPEPSLATGTGKGDGRREAPGGEAAESGRMR